jgi:hypothetical protein
MTTLTKAETVFLSRVADVLVANPTFTNEEAMRAVLARDEQLWLEVATRTPVGNAIAENIARDVHRRARAA